MQLARTLQYDAADIARAWTALLARAPRAGDSIFVGYGSRQGCGHGVPALRQHSARCLSANRALYKSQGEGRTC